MKESLTPATCYSPPTVFEISSINLGCKRERVHLARPVVECVR